MKFFAWLSSTLLFTAVAVATEDEKKAPAELQIVTTFKPEACPNKAQTGDNIKVHYTGTLFSNGNKFDSSVDRGQPLPLTLGVGQVIPGWDQGLQGMCLNEKRTLTIPSHLAYGSRGFGSVIPPNSALVFDVELVGLDAVSHEEL
ncbi:hypothetical protein GALMADRAFT_231922 [Galerina marginata CBS 339.88]|uniref:peptidylprolyl isomerase n=1 Tax=Galerina marginata (strain CBS 339.88) TaxID=685588 RepID=A0A067S9H1_GALM3|nr:hypothetical protein GALMADRAFT_231922 [Galerina marginata CBS 339.88]